MIQCEGYRAFRGTATIRPTVPGFEPFSLTGDWLYKPEWNCWYCKGGSYPAEIVTDIRELGAEALIAEMEARLSVLRDLTVTTQNVAEIGSALDTARAWLVWAKDNAGKEGLE